MRLVKRSAIALVIALSLLSTACPKKDNLVFWGEQVVGAATDAIPILTAAGVSTVKAEQFRDYGNKLVLAIKANDGTALGYAASCIDLLEQVANDAKLITDPARRTTVLVILAVAEVALHHIANALPAPQAGRMSAGRSATTIQNFKAKKAWRCRSSQTGRYAKMDYCRAHPDVTTVETQ